MFVLTGRAGLDVIVAVIIVETDFTVEKEIVVGIVFVVVVDVDGAVVVDVEELVEAVVDVVTIEPAAGIKGDPKIGIPTLFVVLDKSAPGFVVLVIVRGATVCVDASL